MALGPRLFEIVGTHPLTLRDIERAIASFGTVRFVPDMVDGTPTTLRSYEYGLATDYIRQEADLKFGVGKIACQ